MEGVRVCASGGRIFFTNKDGVTALEAATGKELWQIPPGRLWVNHIVAMDAHGDEFVCQRVDRTLHVHDARDGREVRVLPLPQHVAAGQ